jgi:hypothetical protein
MCKYSVFKNIALLRRRLDYPNTLFPKLEDLATLRSVARRPTCARGPPCANRWVRFHCAGEGTGGGGGGGGAWGNSITAQKQESANSIFLAATNAGSIYRRVVGGT